MRRDRGFTLTELLIVISIIGILAGIILVSGGSVRRDARDKRRKADIEQIAGLLQIRAAQVKLSDSSWNQVNDTSSDGTFLPILVNERYTSQIPVDPINTGSTFYSSHFSSSSLGSCLGPLFAVVTRLENQTGGNSNRCSPVAGNNIYAISGQ